MARAAQSPFLEEWLRNYISPPPPPPPPPSPSSSQSPSAQSIIRAWSHLRDALHHQLFEPQHLQSLQTLNLSSQTSLHVADPQAKLLLSLLSLSPPQSQPLILRLLYVWARKSSKPSSSLLESLIPVLSRVFSARVDADDEFIAQGVLLLGAVSAVPELSEGSRRACLGLLCRVLGEELRSIGFRRELVPELLAGIGYALIRSETEYFIGVFKCLLGIWRRDDGLAPCVLHGLPLLHLMEWVTTGFLNSQSHGRIELICGEVAKCCGSGYPQFAVVMASAGILRAFNRFQSRAGREIKLKLRTLVENAIDAVSLDLISQTGNFSNLSSDDHNNHLSLQCIALGLARSGPFSFRAPVLLCLTMSLLMEIFPLPSFYKRAVEILPGGSSILGLNHVKDHVGGFLFREAGAVTSAFVNQYVLADEENKARVEDYIWSYCLESYSNFRVTKLVLQSERNELLAELEKVSEAAFLMVVVFASMVAKHKVSSNIETSHETQSEVSVRILVAFSCLEYLRRVRVPEYSDTIRAVVKNVQENGSTGVSFVESMPSYLEVTNLHGLGRTKYIWSEDEVQTARILFYLRVVPACIEHVPHHKFSEIIAPTMFLYMWHPTGKVARASHGLFASFISSGRDMNGEARMQLKEKLVFYYMQRSLEAYPGITPYEGMASGVAALVRHLPAGSPAIFYCIHCLVEKATSLCCIDMNRDSDMWKSWQGDSGPSKRILELLLHLISLVDIQVLPTLLKLISQFIVQLPKDGQNMVLDEIHSHIAQSDDVTRKPSLVSWLQSVSYLCSGTSNKNPLPLGSSATVRGNAKQNDFELLSLNRTRGRL